MLSQARGPRQPTKHLGFEVPAVLRSLAAMSTSTKKLEPQTRRVIRLRPRNSLGLYSNDRCGNPQSYDEYSTKKLRCGSCGVLYRATKTWNRKVWEQRSEK